MDSSSASGKVDNSSQNKQHTSDCLSGNNGSNGKSSFEVEKEVKNTFHQQKMQPGNFSQYTPINSSHLGLSSKEVVNQEPSEASQHVDVYHVDKVNVLFDVENSENGSNIRHGYSAQPGVSSLGNGTPTESAYDQTNIANYGSERESVCQQETYLHNENANKDAITRDESSTATNCLLNEQDANVASTSVASEDKKLTFAKNNPFVNCLVCKKNINKKQISTHIKIHEMQGLKCSKCGKEMKDYYTFCEHRYDNCGIKPYKCPYCEKTFRRNCYLKSHLQVHSTEKPFKCVCGEAFKQKVHLDNHWASYHTDANGVTINTYPIHQETTLNAKNGSSSSKFVCTICGSTFEKRWFLLKHQRAHYVHEPGEFKCEICNKRLLTKAIFRKHMDIHKDKDIVPDPNKTVIQYGSIKCSVCGKVLLTKVTLRRHMQLLHGNLVQKKERKKRSTKKTK